MARNTQTKKNIRYGLIGLLIIAILAVGKTLLNRFSSGFSLLTNKAAVPKILEAQRDVTNIRPSVNQLHVAIHDEVSKFAMTSETTLVDLMNQCANKEEVVYVSINYQDAYGKSLRSLLRTQLDAGWRKYLFSKGATWDDLNDIVKQNLL